MQRERDYQPQRKSFAGTKSMTKTDQLQATSVNYMLDTFQRTGHLPDREGGAYGDFANVGDFMDCHIRVAEAKEDFDLLPSKLRKRFNNSIPDLIAWLDDPANADEALALKLATREQLGLPPEEPEPNTGPEAPPAPPPEPPAGG